MIVSHTSFGGAAICMEAVTRLMSGVQPLGGTTEVKLLGDDDERAQLPELHAAA